MHRFYLSPEHCTGDTLLLTDSEAHHASGVLRVQRGEPVTVLNGAGTEHLCEVQDVSRKSVSLKVTKRTSTSPLPFQITLCQAIPKGKTMDLILQKATELGAARVVPLVTERVVSRFDEAGARDKKEKWQQVAVEAIKQCGQPWLPQVELPMTPAEFLQHGESFDLALIGALLGESRHPRDYFSKFTAQHKRRPASVCLWIGPEGDFTPAELEQIKCAGALPMNLGRLVLRCETAAIYCLSFVNYELQAQ